VEIEKGKTAEVTGTFGKSHKKSPSDSSERLFFCKVSENTSTTTTNETWVNNNP
jgi:hypothetical protein